MPMSPLATDAAPDVAAVIQAMKDFQAATDGRRLERLPAQTTELRRSELAALIEAIDNARGRLAAILEGVTGLDDWTPYGDTAIDEALGGLRQAGEALYAVTTELNPNQR